VFRSFRPPRIERLAPPFTAGAPILFDDRTFSWMPYDRAGMASIAVGFPTTRFSAIAGARSEDEGVRKRSWDALALAYWRPAYAHLRIKWKRSPDDAADLVQGFFERAVEKDFFAGYDAGRARFRTFLRVCLDRFVSNERRAEGRDKRGGGLRALSIDFGAAESDLARAGTSASPEECFDREWRRAMFAAAIEVLRDECAANGRANVFAAFERYDLAEERPTYEALGRELGVPATTITNHLSLARRELRRILVAKLEAITADEEELRAEAKLLLG
jgi:DNA-directed RNA polymerase specialized sigma24 family protein